jgi:hypothetical protein
VIAKAVADAHAAALSEAMEYLAEHAGYTRVHNPHTGEKDLVRLPGLTAIAYQHETSRCGDPRLHTHVIVPNRQARADGVLVSIDGTAPYHEARAGVTADTTHAVLGENATRALLYVAMTRGREANSAYIYEKATELEYGPDQAQGARVVARRNSQYAGRQLRAIIAHHDQLVTAHDVAAQTPNAALPQRVGRLHDRRAAAVQHRRTTHQLWHAQAQNFATAMTVTRERTVLAGHT